MDRSQTAIHSHVAKHKETLEEVFRFKQFFFQLNVPVDTGKTKKKKTVIPNYADICATPSFPPICLTYLT